MAGTNNQSINIEQHRQILSLTAEGKSARSIASQLGVGATAVLKYQKLPIEGGSLTESDTTSGDKREISLPHTQIKTLDELIAHCEIDLTTWEVERFIANKWESAAKNKEGDITVTPLFQVKAFLKRRIEMIDAKAEIADLVLEAKTLFAASPVVITRVASKPGNLLEISIPDLHIGKRGDPEETGWDKYDVEEALQLHDDALTALLSRAASTRYEKVLYVVGNDLLNADNRALMTTAGTPQNGDGNYYKIFRAARNMTSRAIHTLLAVAPVDVLVVPGNHDELSMWHLGMSLEAMFSGAADVSVDTRATLRKYYQFGNVMLMHTHGNKGKKNDYPLLMAREQPAMWGKTLYREAHVGHLHGTDVKETHGVRVRVLPSLCSADAWHADNAYVGNLRSAEAFQWNRDAGLVGTVIYTVPEKRR